MTKTHEITVSEDRSVTMTTRFRTTDLSRLSSDAPELHGALMQMVGAADPDDSDETRILRAADTTTELVSLPISELEALHEFCAGVIESVEGFEDGDGDPVMWKHLDDEERLEFLDFDVPNSTKLTVVMYAIAIKNGVDPSAWSDDDGGDG